MFGILAVVLTACGGADSEIPRSLPFVGTAALRASAQSASLPGTESRSHPLGLNATIDVESLLNWAESSYPQLFPSGPATQRMRVDGVNFSLRYYPDTENYVGVADNGSVWGYGPFTGNGLKSYGQMTDYTCLVSPKLCEQAPVVCKTEITTGFSGDLNATYNVPDVGGDGASGDGGGGSAGAGGSEGKVLGGRIKVIRLSDGAELGESVTDSTLGLTTIKWCPQDMPVMLELRGAPGAKYFDEAVNSLVDFPLTQKLRALVDKFDENVGVSALTEAAYVYAMNNIVNDPAAIASGKRALVTEGLPVGITTQQVAQANSAVLRETNRFLTTTRRVQSVKSLGTPIGPRGTVDVLPANRYGLAGLLTASLAQQSRANDLNIANPALSASKQFAADLSDGSLNGFSLNGKGVFEGGSRSYQPARMPLSLDHAGYRIAERFSNDALYQLGSGISELSVLNLNLPTTINGAAVTACGPILDVAKIQRDATIRLDRLRFSAFCDLLESTEAIAPFATRVKQLSTSTGRTLFLNEDGNVFGWGRSFCGTLGKAGDGSLELAPVQILGLSDISDISVGAWYGVARNSAGEVFTWGANTNGSLGIGDNVDFDIANCNPYTGKIELGYSPANVRPRRVPGLPPVVSLWAYDSTVTALEADGGAWQWGGGRLPGPIPRKIGGLPAIQSVAMGVTRIDGPVGYNGFYALSFDGTVLYWDDTDYQVTDGPIPSISVSAHRVPSILDITEIVSADQPSDLVALLRRDGTVLLISYGHLTPYTPDVRVCSNFLVRSYDCTLVSSGPLPKMKHISAAGLSDVLLMYGFDGDIYYYDNTRSLLRTLVPPRSGR